ncbi:MAG TPA: hypothetical protein VFO85_21900 [Vicinamibacteria bacterium]|nr:hypothetical protein [Vicinamibacteria bacterium]
MSLGVPSLLLLAFVQTPPSASPAPSPPPASAPAPAAPSSAPSASPEPEVDASGNWKGTTSQGREVEIEVEANEVKLLRVGWQISFDRECPAPETRLPQRTREGMQVMRYQYPETVRAGRLKTRLGVGADLDLSVTGGFAADGTASGEIELATVAGTRCSGRMKGTWTAKRR